MWPNRVSNPGPLALEPDALQTGYPNEVSAKSGGSCSPRITFFPFKVESILEGLRRPKKQTGPNR